MENADKIAKINDTFRRGASTFMLTSGVRALEDVEGLIAAVRSFDTFTEDNDPHHEHDFGSLKWHGEKVFWKLDYYNQELRYWCDPLLPECRRVLTVMLASEY